MKLSVQHTESQDAPHLAVPVNEHDHAQGPARAPVTLVEYGDYECPYCGNAYPIVKRIQAEMGPRLRFVFRNFPLNTVHAHAGIAAQAAEAAAAQGKFWEMHDLVYAHQDDMEAPDFTDDRFVKAAGTLGLDTKKFKADLASGKYQEKVESDVRDGTAGGVAMTPTFFFVSPKSVWRLAGGEERQDEEDADAGVVLGLAGGPRALEGVLDAPDPAAQPARKRRRPEGLQAKAHRGASAATGAASVGATGASAAGAAVGEKGSIGSGVTSTGLAGGAMGLPAT